MKQTATTSLTVIQNGNSGVSCNPHHDTVRHHGEEYLRRGLILGDIAPVFRRYWVKYVELTVFRVFAVETAHYCNMRKPTIVKNAQCRARVLSSLALGLRDEKRWIVQDDRDGADIGWVNGSAQPSLLQESKGYVRPVIHRTVQKSDYDKAPIHRVEVWCHAPNSEFHVRIFGEITECAPGDSREDRSLST